MSEDTPEYKIQDSSPKMRDVALNYSILQGHIQGAMSPGPANKIVKMLDAIIKDVPHEGGLLLGFLNAPAAKRNHHAYMGGLIVHYLEMWNIWTNKFKPDFPYTEHVNDRRIMEGIIYHDLHKAYRTFQLKSINPWEVQYLRDDEENESLTWETKTLWLLQHHGIKLDVPQYSALLWSEGGWAKIQPRWCSVLAKTLYLLDEYSGNVLSRMEDGSWAAAPMFLK